MKSNDYLDCFSIFSSFFLNNFYCEYSRKFISCDKNNLRLFKFNKIILKLFRARNYC